MKKALYLHGLDAVPSAEKIELLTKNFRMEVLGPKLDYYSSIDSTGLFEVMSALVEKEGIELLIGSSFGGYFGFYLSEKHRLPAYLFNPALHSRNIKVPVIMERTNTSKVIILGRGDDIINPEKTKSFLTNHNYENISILEGNFGHQTTPALFGEMLGKAFRIFNI